MRFRREMVTVGNYTARCLTRGGLVMEQFPPPLYRSHARPWHISHAATGLRVCENLPDEQATRKLVAALTRKWSWDTWDRVEDCPASILKEVPGFLTQYYLKHGWTP